MEVHSITVNGVSFNLDVCKKISYSEFLVHPMHENHWPHLSQDDHDKAIAEAYDIIQQHGNDTRNDKPDTGAEPADGADSNSNG
jgi:hypothetical protein